MKCPNCGAEMKDGILYCEHCGEDIHIVPDFEPELEHNIEQSLGHIRKSVEESNEPVQKTVVFSVKQLGFVISILILIIFLVFGIFCLLSYFSVNEQIDKARDATLKGNYDKAIARYEHALELDSLNVDAKFELAEVYFLQNNTEEYEKLLVQIVNDPNTGVEQLESAYGKLIAVYRTQGDYQTINDMLLTCPNEAIKTTYHSYLAMPPVFSTASGEYREVQAIKLTVTGKGIIYYTLDGKDPTSDSTQYTAPILLENGKHIIKAIFVNENGVQSEMVEAEYQIDVEELEEPAVNLEGGEYNVPLMISIINGYENVYYTTDGSIPTMDSHLYTEPIPMPLGVSVFKFARIEPGRISQIVERTYTLVLSTDISAEMAVDKVREHSLATGKIIDNSGHFDETKACYRYQFKYVLNINQAGDYFVIEELLSDIYNVQTKTGNYYAVEAYTGKLYKLQIENGVYTLTDV